MNIWRYLLKPLSSCFMALKTAVLLVNTGRNEQIKEDIGSREDQWKAFR